jgi:hypothetical protein
VALEGMRLQSLLLALRSFKGAVRQEDPALTEASKRSGKKLAGHVIDGLRSGDLSKVGGAFGLTVIPNLTLTQQERQADAEGRLVVPVIRSKPAVSDADMALVRELSSASAVGTLVMLLSLQGDVDSVAPATLATCEAISSAAVRAASHSGVAKFAEAIGASEAGQADATLAQQRGWSWFSTAAAASAPVAKLVELLESMDADLSASGTKAEAATSPVFWFQDLSPLLGKCGSRLDHLRSEVDQLTGHASRAKQLAGAVQASAESTGVPVPPCVAKVTSSVIKQAESVAEAYHAADSQMIHFGVMAGAMGGDLKADAAAATLGWSVFAGIRNVAVDGMQNAIERARRRLRTRSQRTAGPASASKGATRAPAPAVAAAPAPAAASASSGAGGGGLQQQLAAAMAGRFRSLGNHRDATRSGRGGDDSDDDWE